MLSVGDEAPSFRGRDQRGTEISLEALLETGPVVLYFYPKDFTRVCTKEACVFRDAHEELAEQGVTVVGVSIDTEDAHRRFSERHGLPFHLLSDVSRRIARDYDALRWMGLIAKRVTYVIAPDRRILGVFHHETSATRHLDDVRALLARS